MEKIAKIAGLTFDEKWHSYKVHGYSVPSVSRIMKPLSSATYEKIDEEVLRKAAERGTAIHKAIEEYELGNEENELPDIYKGYFDGFLKWFELRKPIVLSPEYMMYHKTLLYAGTTDLLCVIDGTPTVVDYKNTTVVYPKMTRIQTEAYIQMLKSHNITFEGKPFERKIIVQLKKDGTYTEEEHDREDAEALKILTELLDIFNYSKKEY